MLVLYFLNVKFNHSSSFFYCTIFTV